MGEVSAASVVLAAARWLTYIASVLVIGHAGTRFVCWRALRRDAPPALVDAIERRQSAFVAWTAGLLACASLALLLAYSFHWYGLAGFADRIKVGELIDTGWGERWRATAWLAGVNIVAAAVIWRWRRARTPASIVIALGVAAAMPLPGHGGSHGVENWIWHAAHMLGAGLWMGTLAGLLVTTRTIWISGGDATSTLLRRVLNSFSPVALTGAALAIGTGAWLAWNHIMTIEYLLETEFGRTVMVKSASVAMAAGLGFLNWRRLAPGAIDDASRRRLRRIAVIEAIIALVVILALTGWLSGQESPDTFE
jgi:putative copper resistance protein D